MAKVRVRAEGGISRFMPGGRRELEIGIDEGETLQALLERIGVPLSAAQVITVNRESSRADRVLADGDVVSLMPMIVGG